VALPQTRAQWSSTLWKTNSSGDSDYDLIPKPTAHPHHYPLIQWKTKEKNNKQLNSWQLCWGWTAPCFIFYFYHTKFNIYVFLCVLDFDHTVYNVSGHIPRSNWVFIIDCGSTCTRDVCKWVHYRKKKNIMQYTLRKKGFIGVLYMKHRVLYSTRNNLLCKKKVL